MNKKSVNISSLIILLFYFLSSKLAFGNEPRQYIVTTATSNIGTAICETLASKGYSLILGGRDKKINDLKTKLEKYYCGKYKIELFDYSGFSSIEKFGVKLNNYLTKVDGAVIIPPRVRITTMDIPSTEEWLNMFKIGFIAPLEIIKQALPVLQPGGSVVVIAGLTSIYYIPSYQNSNVLRKMWIAEIKNLIYQFGNHKIRVNAISPGVILNDYHKSRIEERAMKFHKTFEKQLEEEVKEIPLCTLGNPIDVAQSVLFLLSLQYHINGVNLVIDGGLSKTY